MKIVAAKVSTLSRWRRKLFILMSNLMVNATDFFGIPIQVLEFQGQWLQRSRRPAAP